MSTSSFGVEARESVLESGIVDTDTVCGVGSGIGAGSRCGAQDGLR